MGARPDLDLSDIMPAYREFLFGEGTSTAGINHIRATPEGDSWEPKPVGDEEAIPGYLYEGAIQRDPLKPWRIGNGPGSCSTSQEVVSARPAFAWDVNGWYRTIGVPFPYVDATSGVLSKSYVASGGQESARATYYLKRLLNKAVRGLYDTYPLGEVFLDDEYVQDELKAKAAAEASRRSREGSYTRPETVMDEWGYKIDPESTDVVDTVDNAVQDGGSQEERPFEPIEWVYSYWMWQTRRNHLPSTDALEQWQGHLVSALARGGHKVEIAVGVAGKSPHPYTVGFFDEHWVVFLHEDQAPSAELAERAATALIDTMGDRHPK